MKFIRVILFLLVAIGAQAQSDYRPGFVVMNNGDTVTGFVKYHVRSLHEKECTFKRDKEGTSTRYLPDELTGYGFKSGRLYVTRTIPIEGVDRKVFLQQLQSGRASLYYHDEKYYIEKDSLFQLPVPKKREVKYKDGTYLAEDKLYAGLLNVVFADCPVALKRPAYEMRWINNAVEAYNRCNGSEQPRQTPSPWTKINWQLFGGAKYITGDPETISSSVFPFAGASLELSSPALNDKVFLSMELMYFKYYRQTSNEYVTSIYTARTDYTYRSSNLSVPFGIRYNFLPENQTAYIKGGIVLNYAFNPSGSTTTEFEQGGVVTTYYSENITESYQGTGFWVGAGYLKSFRPKLSGFLEIRAEFSGQLSLFAGLRF